MSELGSLLILAAISIFYQALGSLLVANEACNVFGVGKSSKKGHGHEPLPLSEGGDFISGFMLSSSSLTSPS
jgi:hypothetical protein